jgi:phage repressor protein C with HTH and peptisase S24 domain
MGIDVNNNRTLTGYNQGYTLPFMENMGDRVRLRRNELKLSQAKLAEIVGCSQPTIRKIEGGGNTVLVLELAKALQVTPEWLKSGSLPLDKDEQSSESTVSESGRPAVSFHPFAGDAEAQFGDDYIFLPRLSVRLSADGGTLVYEIDEKSPRQAFRKAWASRLEVREESAATMIAEDQSMETRIQRGDLLIINHKERDITSGKVYAIAFANELYIRRLFKRPGGGVRIVADNPDKTRFPDWDVGLDQIENLEIIAHVVAQAGAV